LGLATSCKQLQHQVRHMGNGAKLDQQKTI
jgi:hypothetical protein